MPINFQQVREKIQQIGSGAAQRQKALQERQAEARKLLKANASALEMLRARVESAKGADANLRCAVPLNEGLDSSFPRLRCRNESHSSPRTGRRSTPAGTSRSSLGWSTRAESSCGSTRASHPSCIQIAS